MLRDARRAAGLTQAELANRAGTSQATLSAYEHGRKQPSVATLDRLLRAAGRRLTTTVAAREPTPAELEHMAAQLADVLDLAAVRDALHPMLDADDHRWARLDAAEQEPGRSRG